MKATIGRYNAAARTVAVKFEHLGVVHRRPVNACHKSDGKYDAEATGARVAELAAGVAQKIEFGAIKGD